MAYSRGPSLKPKREKDALEKGLRKKHNTAGQSTRAMRRLGGWALTWMRKCTQKDTVTLHYLDFQIADRWTDRTIIQSQFSQPLRGQVISLQYVCTWNLSQRTLSPLVSIWEPLGPSSVWPAAGGAHPKQPEPWQD